ncbi:hypothetical protein BB560_004069 [Smittium megazygosporum]|uniref:RNA helicase n=1 Tax=Smittium megazygosporum TaxID=133381 RepID=A0A2T9ZAA6_9FUNG|nr:hypothetical protein BB560_004069 [Smittium megazygosporum]
MWKVEKKSVQNQPQSAQSAKQSIQKIADQSKKQTSAATNNGKAAKQSSKTYPSSKRNKTSKKVPKNENTEKPVNSEEPANTTIPKHTWKKVNIPKRMAPTDDEIGGVVEFEEIDGDYYDFALNLQKNTDSTASKDFEKFDQSEDIMSDEEFNNIDWDDFIFLDDFSEENAKAGKIKSIGHPKPTFGSSSKQTVLHGNNDSVWKKLGLCDDLVTDINNLGFSTPTKIQEEAIPVALSGDDVLGAAETGSGKTLAFGLPILNYIIQNRSNDMSERQLQALILLPTRELALQVTNSLKSASKSSVVNIVPLFGGMSVQKQERQLRKSPEILVATPGRLWEIIEQTDLISGKIELIKFLVLDEADRLVEKGHFNELSQIIHVVNQGSSGQIKRQTMVFSATLAKDLSFGRKNKPAPKQKTTENSMQKLVNTLKFRDPVPKFIDLTPVTTVSEKVFESRIDCIKEEKETYLYLFLTRFTGKSLVFVNSISTIRRLVPILTNLGISVYPLHAQMQQRQRLKNLDRFKANPNSVLVSSDVAARGLDIPAVDHVIHYQVPRGGELYVHRSGRTARAQLEGVVIIFVCPEERGNYLKLCKTLGKTSIPVFPLEYKLLSKVKPLVVLSQKVDSIEHRLKKETHEEDWISKTCQELDIEVENKRSRKNKKRKSFESIIIDEDDDDLIQNDKFYKEKAQLQKYREELRYLLKKPILAHETFRNYISGGADPELIKRLLDGGIRM